MEHYGVTGSTGVAINCLVHWMTWTSMSLANPTVVVSSGSHSIKSLHSAEALTLSGGTLQVSGNVQVDNTFTLNGGTLRNATVMPGIAGQGINVSTFGTLDGVTLNADATVSGSLFVSNGLELNGVLTLNNSINQTKLIFTQGVQTLAGTGQVVLAGTQSFGEIQLGYDGPTTLTVASGHHDSRLRFDPSEQQQLAHQPGHNRRRRARRQMLSLYPNLNSFTNDGTMRASGGGILEVACNWTNKHLIEAIASTLTLKGSWTNAAGVITATNSTTNLGGTFTMAKLGTFNRTGGVVNLTGVLDNRTQTFELNAATGSWKLDGGKIWGGTITTSDGAALSTSTFGTLDGVTLNTDMTVPGTLFVTNGLVLNGVLTLNNTSNQTKLIFTQGVQTLAGTGQVVLAGTQSGRNPTGLRRPDDAHGRVRASRFAAQGRSFRTTTVRSSTRAQSPPTARDRCLVSIPI